jgi:hypothetical protein
VIEPANYDYLLDKTRSVLSTLVETAPFLSNFSLVGGSALALYLRHRKSDDLNFFTYADSYNRLEILEYLRRFAQSEILNDSGDQIDVLIDGTKVTFFNAGWGLLEPVEPAALNVASLESIAAMKTNVLFVRAKYRDYYDLYTLARRVMSLRQIFECAQPLVSGLTFKLFCIALTYIDDIEDESISHLEPEESVTLRDIRAYFEHEIRG